MILDEPIKQGKFEHKQTQALLVLAQLGSESKNSISIKTFVRMHPGVEYLLCIVTKENACSLVNFHMEVLFIGMHRKYTYVNAL